MQIYDVRYEERRQGRLSVVADTREAAEQQAKETLRLRGRKARITGAAVSGTQPETGSGMEALELLLDQPFLEPPATVKDWIVRAIDHLPDGNRTTARASAEHERANRALAPAGLRVYGTQAEPVLYVARSPAIGFLRETFEGSAWAGGQWAPALRELPGSFATNLTLAGFRTRCIGLPMRMENGFLRPGHG